MEKYAITLATLIIWVLFIWSWGCEDPNRPRKRSAKIQEIVCELPGGKVKTYKTRERLPMFRGGFSFRTVDGTKIMNTRCHIEVK